MNSPIKHIELSEGRRMVFSTKNKAQSTVEYILLVTAVIMVAVYYMATHGSPLQTKLRNTMDVLSDQMVNSAQNMASSP